MIYMWIMVGFLSCIALITIIAVFSNNIDKKQEEVNIAMLTKPQKINVEAQMVALLLSDKLKLQDMLKRTDKLLIKYIEKFDEENKK